MIYTLIIVLLSLFGFLLCRKIHKEKKTENPIVCFAKTDCEVAVRGQFSSFLGIGLEVFGGIYYLFIFISYIILYYFDFPFEDIYSFLVLISSAMAFLFSVCLTLIQAFVIKTWCSWCLISAAISTLIFLFVSLNAF